MDGDESTTTTATYRLGKWLPSDQDALEAELDRHARRVKDATEPVTLHPVIAEFHDLIEQDPVVRMYITDMIAQVPTGKQYRTNHLESVDHLLLLLNDVLTRAPDFNETDLVGAPLNAIIDRAMGTPAGRAAFRHDAINAMVKRILTAWSHFLSSRASLYVLNDTPTGWTCAAAQKAIGIQEYHYDPRDEHWGFASWNDFFTRRFKDGARPIAEPDNDKVIVSACEATPYRISARVKKQDTFWLKSQPYSLRDMLANDEAVDGFVGGTVYQAYLSALNYHRWHSPVAGTIRKAFVQEGTYYSEADSVGEDPSGPQESQAYLTHVATRAIILIDCDDPAIGLVGVLFVGMVEVSSCIIHPEIAPGHRVRKGDELGHFQYGGSTYCLVFRPGVIADVSLGAIPEPDNPDAPLVLMGAKVVAAH